MQQINQYLDPTLVRKSDEWQKLKDLLVLALPPEVQRTVVYATLEDTKLTVFCESPAWTAKLRFYDAEIRKVMSKHGTVVRAVAARSVPPVAPRS
jgi:predicted nucleic acid-binding Zn ribbon protein